MNCSTATQKLQSLQILRTQLGEAILAYKESQASGNTAKAEELKQQARELKQQLESGIIEMNSEMLEFTVANAINPYAKAFQEAGLPVDHPECAERKEITLDINKTIEIQIEYYKNQNLPEWADDIEENEEKLFTVLCDPEEQEKIEKRIMAGLIPIVMPSRETQQKTWRKSLEDLKPIWIEDGKKMKQEKNRIRNELFSQKMFIPPPSKASEKTGSFFDGIPDRPYLVWVRPERKIDFETTEKEYIVQKRLLNKLHHENPDIVDPTDIIPTEFAALYSLVPQAVYECVHKEISDDKIQSIGWGDGSTCRFISSGCFSDGSVPSAVFNNGGFDIDYNRTIWIGMWDQGFLTVARS